MSRTDHSNSVDSSVTTATAPSGTDLSLNDQGGARSGRGAQDSAMRVYVRIRPFNVSELPESGEGPNRTLALDTREGHIRVLDPSRNFVTRMTYVFERCFDSASAGPGADQDEVYRYVGSPVLRSTVDGYNGCIFAYGQSGTGKTYTMLGPKDALATGRLCRDELIRYDSFSSSVTKTKFCSTSLSCSGQGRGMDGSTVLDLSLGGESFSLAEEGIIPRLARDLFNSLREKQRGNSSYSFRVEMEFYEIYNEKVFDLISNNSSSTDLRVRQQPTRGVFVEGIESKQLSGEWDLLFWISRGSVERHTSSTKINDRSSRSHAILSIHVVQLTLDENNNTNRVKSKLNLVDLAGSERIGASGVEGLHFKESTKINLSLTALGRVIDALADASSGNQGVFCPYRDSNLTWLLMDSLGGNSKTSMIATVSPCVEHYEITCQTLRYASRAKQIVNVAVVNEDPQVREIKRLTAEVSRLRQLLGNQTLCDYTSEEVDKLRQRILQLQQELVERDFLLETLRGELDSRNLAASQHRYTGSEPSRQLAKSRELANDECGERRGSQMAGPHLSAKTAQQLKHLRISTEQDYDTLVTVLTQHAFEASLNYENMLKKNTMMINSHSHALREVLLKLEAKEWTVLASIGERLLSEYAKACSERAHALESVEATNSQGCSNLETEIQGKNIMQMEKAELRRHLYDTMLRRDELQRRCEALEGEVDNLSKVNGVPRKKVAYTLSELGEKGTKVVIQTTRVVKTCLGTTVGSGIKSAREFPTREDRKSPPEPSSARSVLVRKLQLSPRERERRVARRLAPKSRGNSDLEVSTGCPSLPVVCTHRTSAATRLKLAFDAHCDAVLNLMFEKFLLAERLYEQCVEQYRVNCCLANGNGDQGPFGDSAANDDGLLTARKVSKRSAECQKKTELWNDSQEAKGRSRIGVAKKGVALERVSIQALHSPRGSRKAKTPRVTTAQKVPRGNHRGSNDVSALFSDEDATSLRKEFKKRERKMKETHELAVRELQHTMCEELKKAAEERRELLDRSLEEKRQLQEQLARCKLDASAIENMRESTRNKIQLEREQYLWRSCIEREQMETWASTVVTGVVEVCRLREEQVGIVASEDRQQLLRQVACDKDVLTRFYREASAMLLEWITGREDLLREEERAREPLTFHLGELAAEAEDTSKFMSVLVESHELVAHRCMEDHRILIEHVTALRSTFRKVCYTLMEKQKRLAGLEVELRVMCEDQSRKLLQRCVVDEVNARSLVLAAQERGRALIKDKLWSIGGGLFVHRSEITELRNRWTRREREQCLREAQRCVEYEAGVRQVIAAAERSEAKTIKAAFMETNRLLLLHERQSEKLSSELECSRERHRRQGVWTCLNSEANSRVHLVAHQKEERDTLESCFGACNKVLKDSVSYVDELLASACCSSFGIGTSKVALGGVLLLEQYKGLALEELNVHATSLQNVYRRAFACLSLLVQREYEDMLVAVETHHTEELGRLRKENKELTAKATMLRDNIEFLQEMVQFQSETKGGDGSDETGVEADANNGFTAPFQKRPTAGIGGLISNIFTRVGYSRKDALPRDVFSGALNPHAEAQEAFDASYDTLKECGHPPIELGRTGDAEEVTVENALFPAADGNV